MEVKVDCNQIPHYFVFLQFLAILSTWTTSSEWIARAGQVGHERTESHHGILWRGWHNKLIRVFRHDWKICTWFWGAVDWELKRSSNLTFTFIIPFGFVAYFGTFSFFSGWWMKLKEIRNGRSAPPWNWRTKVIRFTYEWAWYVYSILSSYSFCFTLSAASEHPLFP